MSQNITKTQDKSVTETDKIRIKPVCLLNEKHEYLDGVLLLKRLNRNSLVTRSIAEQERICVPCLDEAKRKYAYLINSKRIHESFEEYCDKKISYGFELIINQCIKYNVRTELEYFQRELEEYISKKNYNAELKANEQRIAYLRSQNYYIYDYSKDPNNILTYAIHFPLYRLSTSKREAKAIRELGEDIRTGFHGKCFLVYRDPNIKEDNL